MELGTNKQITEQATGAPPQTVGALLRMCIYGKEDVTIGSICIKRKHLWTLWRIFKYGVVGVTSLLIHLGLYSWMSRVIWVSGNRTLEYAVALVCASIFNFTLHRLWTYNAGAFQLRMLAKYIVVIGSSMLMQSLVFHICIDWLHLFDYFAFAISAVFAIIYQYFLHLFFTFKSR
jgi:putative flippase GtrA